MKQFLKKLMLGVVTLALLCGFTPAACAARSVYQYTVYLDPQGGVCDQMLAYAYKGIWSGYRLTEIPTPTLEGYVFEGWYDDMVGGTKVTTSYQFASDEMTIYAHWVPDVSAKKDSGTGEAEADPSFKLSDHLGTVFVVAGVAVVVVAVIAAQAAQ